MIRQEDDIVLALTQRRKMDGNDVQAIKEILPEFSFRNELAQVAVCRRDYSYVEADD
jgi:hypothetical protein